MDASFTLSLGLFLCLKSKESKPCYNRSRANKERNEMTIILGIIGLLLMIYLFWFLFKGEEI